MICKLLVANRGEIAVRIFRTAKEMGIRTVSVFSEADRHSPFVALSDESVEIGPALASESYLNIDRILAAAKTTGADAIHPGYGFLSEHPEFSEACLEAGITFVGPSPEAMRLLGSKANAKQVALELGVSIVPGLFSGTATFDELKDAARAIGYPIMLKAAAGGGGRGMRMVRFEEDFLEAFTTATDEALRGFGDGAMMVEKFVDSPRHVEAQVLADHHGNVVCLFERECSLQRRHQKLVEEAPSPYISSNPSMWYSLKEASERLIKASRYLGAATVEFMVDEPTGTYYFLEVNTRLQVEHPVTEAITGLDLVEWQLRIAQGESISHLVDYYADGRSYIGGHSIEVRIVAEEPDQEFLPSIGKILAWAEPSGPGIRVDSGYRKGSEVSRFYDSLLAKLIVHAETRMRALQKLRQALLDFHVIGVKTNIAYLLDVISDPEFEEGQFDTNFLERRFIDWKPPEASAAIGSVINFAERNLSENVPSSRAEGIWSLADGFRVLPNS